MTETDTTEVVDTPQPSKPAWRTLVGAAIGGGAIVIAAAFGVGAIKSDGASNVRAGGPGGGQFPFQRPQGQPGQFGPPGQGRMQGQVNPPPPFVQR